MCASPVYHAHYNHGTALHRSEQYSTMYIYIAFLSKQISRCSYKINNSSSLRTLLTEIAPQPGAEMSCQWMIALNLYTGRTCFDNTKLLHLLLQQLLQLCNQKPSSADHMEFSWACLVIISTAHAH